MLDHADAHHPIKLLGDFAIVVQLDFHVQSAAPTLRVLQLLPRNCYPDYLATIVAGGITGQSTPATADVQQAKAGSQTQPLANPIQLPQLRRGEIVALGKERTGILHVRIEHCFEKIIAQIVMHLANSSGASGSLLVRENRSEECPDIGKSKFETLLEPGTNGTATHLIQRVAVPPAVHVRFPETECPGSEDSAKEAPVMHLYVPETRAVDANIRGREQIGHHILGSRHMIWLIAGSASSQSRESRTEWRLV
jgi:hypothetical protein